MDRNEIALRIFIERSDMHGGTELDADRVHGMVQSAFTLADAFVAELKKHEPRLRQRAPFDMALELPRREETKPVVEHFKTQPREEVVTPTTFTDRSAEVSRPVPDLPHGDQGKKKK